MKKKKLILKFFNLSTDTCLLALTVFLVGEKSGQFSYNSWFYLLYIGLAVSVIFLFRVYSIRIQPLIFEINRIVLSLIFTFPLAFLLNYLIFNKVLLSQFILYLFFASLVALIISHLFFYFLDWLFQISGIIRINILIFGYSRSAERLIKDFQKHSLIKIVGIIDNVIKSGTETSGVRVLGKYNVLEKIIQGEKIDQIFQTTGAEQTVNLLTICQKNKVELKILPNLVGIYRDRIETEKVFGVSLLRVVGTPLTGWGQVFKRFFDLLLSPALIIIFLPWMFFIWLGLKIANFKKPVIIVDQRYNGFEDKEFSMYRFRGAVIMPKNKISSRYEQNTIQLNKLKTKQGSFYQNALVELPQLFNVFWGQMSLIGPRPPYLTEAKNYNNTHRKRFLVKPGMLSLATIQSRQRFSEMFQADLCYIEKWSPLLDFKILILSVWYFIKRLSKIQD